MTGVQRWAILPALNDARQMTLAPSQAANGEYVTYVDHLAAVAEAEARGLPEGVCWYSDAEVGSIKGAAYMQGAADERARIRAAVLGLETHWRWPKHRLGLDRLAVLAVIDGGAE